MTGRNVNPNIRRFAIPFTNSCICVTGCESYIEDNPCPHLVPDSVSSLTDMRRIKSEFLFRESGRNLNTTPSFISNLGSVRRKGIAEKCLMNFICDDTSKSRVLLVRRSSTAGMTTGRRLWGNSGVKLIPKKLTAGESPHGRRNIRHMSGSSVKFGRAEAQSTELSGQKLKKVQSVRSGVGLVWRNSRTGQTIPALPRESVFKSRILKSSENSKGNLQRSHIAQAVKSKVASFRNKSSTEVKVPVERNVPTVKSEDLPNAGMSLQDPKRHESVKSNARPLDKRACERSQVVFSKVHTVKSDGLVQTQMKQNSVKNVRSAELPVQKRLSSGVKSKNLKTVHTLKSDAIVRNRLNVESKVAQQQIKKKEKPLDGPTGKPLKTAKSAGRVDDEIMYIPLPDYSHVKAKVGSFRKDPPSTTCTKRRKKVNEAKSDSVLDQKKSNKENSGQNLTEVNANPAKDAAVGLKISIAVGTDQGPETVQPEDKGEDDSNAEQTSKVPENNNSTTTVPQSVELENNHNSSSLSLNTTSKHVPQKSRAPPGSWWQLPRVAKEIYNYDQRIQIIALRRLSDLLLSDAECKRATFEFEIIQRLLNVLLRFRMRKQKDQEVAELILQCYCILSLTLRGAIEMAKRKALINEFYIMTEEDTHRRMSSCILKILTQHPIVIKYFIEQTQWFCVLSRILNDNLLSRLDCKLLEHFSHFIEIYPQMGINNGFFEMIFGEIRIRQPNQQILLKCFALFLNCEEGLRLLEKYDGIRDLYEVLIDDHLTTYEFVALAIRSATATKCYSLNRCKAFPLLVDTLIRRAEVRCSKRQKLYCLQILRQITNKLSIKKLVRKRYVPRIRNIQSSSRRIREAQKMLLRWIRKRVKKKRKKKRKSKRVTAVKTDLELRSIQLSIDDSEKKAL